VRNQAVWDALPSLKSLGDLGAYGRVWIVHNRCGGRQIEARLSVSAQMTSVHVLFDSVPLAKRWLISEGLDWQDAKPGQYDETILGNAV